MMILKKRWTRSFTNELGRLAQVINNDGSGTNTVTFIPFTDIPPENRSQITYGNIVVDYKEHKQEPYRTRITVGGDRIRYPGILSTPTAEITTVKTLLYSVISTVGANFMTIDIRHFYLNTPMDIPEFMFLPRKVIPEEIVKRYDLERKVHKDKVYMQVNKGMYGLPQAGKLAHEKLIDKMTTYGYYPCNGTPGLWRHKWRPIMFTLVVDDFGVKYVGEKHAKHLVTALQQQYSQVVVNWSGDRYCGMTLTWNYATKHVDISMPHCCRSSLTISFVPDPVL